MVRTQPSQGWYTGSTPVRAATYETAILRGKTAKRSLTGSERVYGYKPPDDRNWRASDDRAQAFKCCLAIADGDEVAAEHLLAYALRRAETLVEQYWGAMGRVAYGLLCYERLTGDQVREIIERTRAEQSVKAEQPVAA